MKECLILLLLTIATSVGLEGSCSAEDGVGASVEALIPARSGSKGIRRKNLSRIGNETLLARAVRRIQQSGRKYGRSLTALARSQQLLARQSLDPSGSAPTGRRSRKRPSTMARKCIGGIRPRPPTKPPPSPP